MNKPPNRCIFCGQLGNMSQQHVFPDRLKRVLPRVHGTREYGSWDEVRRARKTVKSDERVKRSQGSMGTSRVRKVCKPCNEGWLNIMEQDSVPVLERLISGELTALQREDQERLARVATSIAMTGESLARNETVTDQGEREFFREKLHPPPNWFVFLGRAANASAEPALFKEACIRSGDKRTPELKVFSAFTIVLGNVILHVITTAADTFLHPDSYAKVLGLASICPPTDWVNFALMPALHASEIAGVASYAKHSFRGFIEGT